VDEELLADGAAETTEERLIRGEMSECVRGLIEQLPEGYRTVLLLSEMEGLADAEIAKVVGSTLEAAKIRLHRARRRLRAALEEECRLYHDGEERLRCDRKGPAAGA